MSDLPLSSHSSGELVGDSPAAARHENELHSAPFTSSSDGMDSNLSSAHAMESTLPQEVITPTSSSHELLRTSTHSQLLPTSTTSTAGRPTFDRSLSHTDGFNTTSKQSTTLADNQSQLKLHSAAMRRSSASATTPTSALNDLLLANTTTTMTTPTPLSSLKPISPSRALIQRRLAPIITSPTNQHLQQQQQQQPSSAHPLNVVLTPTRNNNIHSPMATRTAFVQTSSPQLQCHSQQLAQANVYQKAHIQTGNTSPRSAMLLSTKTVLSSTLSSPTTSSPLTPVVFSPSTHHHISTHASTSSTLLHTHLQAHQSSTSSTHTTPVLSHQSSRHALSPATVSSAQRSKPHSSSHSRTAVSVSGITSPGPGSAQLSSNTSSNPSSNPSSQPSSNASSTASTRRSSTIRHNSTCFTFHDVNQIQPASASASTSFSFSASPLSPSPLNTSVQANVTSTQTNNLIVPHEAFGTRNHHTHHVRHRSTGSLPVQHFHEQHQMDMIRTGTQATAQVNITHNTSSVTTSSHGSLVSTSNATSMYVDLTPMASPSPFELNERSRSGSQSTSTNATSLDSNNTPHCKASKGAIIEGEKANKQLFFKASASDVTPSHDNQSSLESEALNLTSCDEVSSTSGHGLASHGRVDCESPTVSEEVGAATQVKRPLAVGETSDSDDDLESVKQAAFVKVFQPTGPLLSPQPKSLAGLPHLSIGDSMADISIGEAATSGEATNTTNQAQINSRVRSLSQSSAGPSYSPSTRTMMSISASMLSLPNAQSPSDNSVNLNNVNVKSNNPTSSTTSSNITPQLTITLPSAHHLGLSHSHHGGPGHGHSLSHGHHLHHHNASLSPHQTTDSPRRNKALAPLQFPTTPSSTKASKASTPSQSQTSSSHATHSSSALSSHQNQPSTPAQIISMHGQPIIISTSSGSASSRSSATTTAASSRAGSRPSHSPYGSPKDSTRSISSPSAVVLPMSPPQAHRASTSAADLQLNTSSSIDHAQETPKSTPNSKHKQHPHGKQLKQYHSHPRKSNELILQDEWKQSQQVDESTSNTSATATTSTSSTTSTSEASQFLAVPLSDAEASVNLDTDSLSNIAWSGSSSRKRRHALERSPNRVPQLSLSSALALVQLQSAVDTERFALNGSTDIELPTPHVMNTSVPTPLSLSAIPQPQYRRIGGSGSESPVLSSESSLSNTAGVSGGTLGPALTTSASCSGSVVPSHSNSHSSTPYATSTRSSPSVHARSSASEHDKSILISLPLQLPQSVTQSNYWLDSQLNQLNVSRTELSKSFSNDALNTLVNTNSTSTASSRVSSSQIGEMYNTTLLDGPETSRRIRNAVTISSNRQQKLSNHSASTHANNSNSNTNSNTPNSIHLSPIANTKPIISPHLSKSPSFDSPQSSSNPSTATTPTASSLNSNTSMPVIRRSSIVHGGASTNSSSGLNSTISSGRLAPIRGAKGHNAYAQNNTVHAHLRRSEQIPRPKPEIKNQVDRAQSFTPLCSDNSSSSSSSSSNNSTGFGTPYHNNNPDEDGEDDTQFSTLASVSELSKASHKYSVSTPQEFQRKAEEEEAADKSSGTDDKYSKKIAPHEVATVESWLKRMDKS